MEEGERPRRWRTPRRFETEEIEETRRSEIEETEETEESDLRNGATELTE